VGVAVGASAARGIVLCPIGCLGNAHRSLRSGVRQADGGSSRRATAAANPGLPFAVDGGGSPVAG